MEADDACGPRFGFGQHVLTNNSIAAPRVCARPQPQRRRPSSKLQVATAAMAEAIPVAAHLRMVGVERVLSAPAAS